MSECESDSELTSLVRDVPKRPISLSGRAGLYEFTDLTTKEPRGSWVRDFNKSWPLGFGEIAPERIGRPPGHTAPHRNRLRRPGPRVKNRLRTLE